MDNASFSKAVTWAYIENCTTLAATAATVVGLAYFTGSLHSLWGLLILLNINTVKVKNAEPPSA